MHKERCPSPYVIAPSGVVHSRRVVALTDSAAAVVAAVVAATATAIEVTASAAEDEKQDDDHDPAAIAAETATVVTTHNIKSSFGFLHPILCLPRRRCYCDCNTTFRSILRT